VGPASFYRKRWLRPPRMGYLTAEPAAPTSRPSLSTRYVGVFLRGRFLHALEAKGSGCGSSDEEVAVEAFPTMETRRVVIRLAVHAGRREASDSAGGTRDKSGTKGRLGLGRGTDGETGRHDVKSRNCWSPFLQVLAQKTFFLALLKGVIFPCFLRLL